MIRPRFAAFAALLALALGACGGSGTPRASSTGAPSNAPPVSAPPSAGTASPSASASTRPPGHENETPEEHEAHENDPSTISGKYAPSRPPPSGFRPPDSGTGVTGRGAMPLELKIDPGCAEPGQTVTVILRTGPDLMIGLQSSIPDETDHPAEADGRSDSDGLFLWRLLIPARMESGTYDVLAAAADDKGDRGGKNGHWLFVVGKPGQCKS